MHVYMLLLFNEFLFLEIFLNQINLSDLNNLEIVLFLLPAVNPAIYSRGSYPSFCRKLLYCH